MDKTVKKGDILYIPTSVYIDHGEDDVAGGKATVREIYSDTRLPENHCNRYMVSFFGLPGRKYNMRYLLENQENLEKEYGERLAHEDPDYGK